MSDRDEPRLTVAVFRPDDDRLDEAVALLDSLGADPVPDPMLAVQPTGRCPRSDADYTVFTSKTGVELAAGERAAGSEDPDASGDAAAAPADRWQPGDTTVCAIGESTADALRAADYRVDRVPEEYTSQGLVDALSSEVAGARVEVARSDHGSAVLLDGLNDADAYVHETVLYRLVRPPGAGASAELAASGDLDAAAFTSSLTVEHFLEAAEERDIRADAVAGLGEATVGVIGEPTRKRAESHGIEVDVVPGRADFEELACEVVETAAPSHHGR